MNKKRFLITFFTIIFIMTALLPVEVLASSNRKTCHHKGCRAYAISHSSYCSSHTCGKGRSGCYNEVNSANSLCSSCKRKSSSSTRRNNGKTSYSNTKRNTYSYSKKKTTSSSARYQMPDCDDYEDYGDFMDDWDGCMPDGSDAEDYWENW